MSLSRRRDMQQMLADINSEVGYTRHLIGKTSLDQRVMDAMIRVPRDEFVPDEMKKNWPLTTVPFRSVMAKPSLSPISWH